MNHNNALVEAKWRAILDAHNRRNEAAVEELREKMSRRYRKNKEDDLDLDKLIVPADQPDEPYAFYVKPNDVEAFKEYMEYIAKKGQKL